MRRLIFMVVALLGALGGLGQTNDTRHWVATVEYGHTTHGRLSCTDYSDYWQIEAKAGYRMPLYKALFVQPEAGLNFRKHNMPDADFEPYPGWTGAGESHNYSLGLDIDVMAGVSLPVRNLLLLKRVDFFTGPVMDWNFVQKAQAAGYDMDGEYRVFMDWRFGISLGLTRDVMVTGSYNVALTKSDSFERANDKWTVGVSYHFRL